MSIKKVLVGHQYRLDIYRETWFLRMLLIRDFKSPFCSIFLMIFLPVIVL